MGAKRGRGRKWVQPCAIILLLYGLLAGWAEMTSDSMIFQPRYGSFARPPGGATIKTADGRELSILYLPNPSARYTVWYFHGNAEDLGNVAPHLRALHDLGFAVFAYDYPGYGLSPGPVSEKEIYASTNAARAYLRATWKIPAEKIIVYGRSLGGGPAVELAAHESVAGLVLESAFMSAFRVMTHWRLLPFDKFANLRKISEVRCPVLVMHGREDRVVPFYHGEALLAAVRAPKAHFWVEDAGHNDFVAVAGAAYGETLRHFAAGLNPAHAP